MMSPSKASVIQSLADAPVDYSADIKTKAGGVRLGGQLDLSLGGSLDHLPSVLSANTGEDVEDQVESRTNMESRQHSQDKNSSEADSSAWYHSDFKLSPTKAYLEKQPIPPSHKVSTVTSVAESSVDDHTFVGFGMWGAILTYISAY